eukprot:3616268-Pyramimonas_sp.AAC.1
MPQAQGRGAEGDLAALRRIAVGSSAWGREEPSDLAEDIATLQRIAAELDGPAPPVESTRLASVPPASCGFVGRLCRVAAGSKGLSKVKG